jgi:hypothetical protein
MSSANDERLHPSDLPEETLLSQCDVRRLRRSGPGGQHRNKVETAVVLTHRPTGISAEANERRSQSQNHAQAVFRLRMQLALRVRLGSPGNQSGSFPEVSPLWKSRCIGGRIKIRSDHPDFPALLAEVLDVFAIGDFDLKPVAEHLHCTPTQLVKFLKIEPKAFASINAHRESRGLFALK